MYCRKFFISCSPIILVFSVLKHVFGNSHDRGMGWGVKYSFGMSHMLFQLFRDSCLAETKIGLMDSFAKLLNEGCVQMYFILMISRVMLIPNYFARRQTKDTVCTHCCPNKDPKNCCPPSEVADTVTHCHILNFHYTKTRS